MAGQWQTALNSYGTNFVGQPARNIPISAAAAGNPMANPIPSPAPVKTPIEPLISAKDNPNAWRGDTPGNNGLMKQILLHATNMRLK